MDVMMRSSNRKIKKMVRKVKKRNYLKKIKKNPLQRGFFSPKKFSN